MTSRERELFEETEFTKPIDFHSWRRAYNQALADAGVNAQQAAALAGHASLDAHSRYLHNTNKAREIPAAALPAISIQRVAANDAEGFAPGSAGTPKLAAGAEGQMPLFSAIRLVGHEGLVAAQRIGWSGEREANRSGQSCLQAPSPEMKNGSQGSR